MLRSFLTAVVALVVSGQLLADWPTYRADAARSGFTTDALPDELSLIWKYHPRHAPRPAWKDGDARMPFDRAFQPIIGGGRLYFGSSADGKVYAIDAATGSFAWEFYTNAPVRFAPAFADDRLYVVSDDGSLYCLDALDGSFKWQKHGGPRSDMILGNGRLISRWPARGGPVILDGIVYFAAGIWPTEGIHLYAIDTRTAKTVWHNDTAGGLELDQPHPTARAKSGISAQGYLAAVGDHLLVPTGRAVPARLDRNTGEFTYFHLQKYGRLGGSAVAADPALFFNSRNIFSITDGQLIAQGPDPALLAFSPDRIVYAEGSQIVSHARGELFTERESVDRKGNKIKRLVLNEPTWRVQLPHPVDTALILAGETVIGLGGEGENHFVTAVRMGADAAHFTSPVDGAAYGLAVAEDRLYVSTDRGTIYCFAAPSSDSPVEIHRPVLPPDDPDPRCVAAAEEIINRTKVTQGYCVDVGCGDGQLARALAERTDLQIFAIQLDPGLVHKTRIMLDAAGLYGTRVTVHHVNPNGIPYPDYFADLVVSSQSITGKPLNDGFTEVARRMQRPCGGQFVTGPPDQMKLTTRGPLEGAGAWTHQYADPANTCNSSDTRVTAPLGALWFDDVEIDLPNRHGRGPAPLFADGRLIVEGVDGLVAMNAYNGRTLWTYPLPGVLKAYDQEHLVGAAATQSNLCTAGGAIYVCQADRCLKLDSVTGRKLAEFKAPPRPDGSTGTWGYLACSDGILLGSVVNEDHIVKHAFLKSDMTGLFSESLMLFAMDARTGDVRWTFTPAHSIRHNAIAVGEGRVHLIDRPLAVGDRSDSDDKETPQPPGKLITLDLATGSGLWDLDENIDGTMLALSVDHDVLLMCYQATRFSQRSERGSGMSAFKPGDGSFLWRHNATYASRPVINDRTIYAQPTAWDLLTGRPIRITHPDSGESVPWQFTRSYGCGILAGCANLMVFRSATLGYLDLQSPPETINYGGVRPGCWINAIPAGGLVLVPDATSDCTCSYLMRTSIALQPLPPRPENQAGQIYP